MNLSPDSSPSQVSPPAASRPWPVVLLTALGAWLATLPLVGVVALLLGDLLVSGIGPYLVGPLLLLGAGVVLRAEGVGTFLEQLAVPMLLLGGVTLGFGLYRDLPFLLASLGLAAIAVGVALTIRGAWLQALLGACAVALLLVGLGHQGREHPGVWVAVHVAVLLWSLLTVHTAGQTSGPRDACLDAIGTGWLLGTLAALASSAGMSFLAGGVLGGLAFGTGVGGLGGFFGPAAWPRWGSAALALAAGVLLWQQRPALQRPWWAGVLAVGMLLAAWMPWLGAAWWLAARCVTLHHPRRAAAAGLAAVWIIGAFYYTLDWPLASKAAVLVGAGISLGLLAWWGLRAARTDAVQATAKAAATRPANRARLGILVSAVAVLAVANVGIWQKEDLIAHGRPVFVELAPVDPRSLMQGDYMALDYRLGDTLRSQLEGADRLGEPLALARLDARGVAQLERLADPAGDAVLPAGSLRIALTPKAGRWVVASDAWFFREGDGERWAAARYGEFRVVADGRALLVGLADAELRPIRPRALSPAATAPPRPAAAPAPAPPASGG